MGRFPAVSYIYILLMLPLWPPTWRKCVHITSVGTLCYYISTDVAGKRGGLLKSVSGYCLFILLFKEE